MLANLQIRTITNRRFVMGKDTKASLPSSVATRTAEIDVEAKSMTVLKDGGVKITVHVKPGAKTTQVTDVTNDAVGISLAAQAREGEANQELIGFLSETLGVKKYEVSIIAGHKSREKTIRVGNIDVGTVQRLLKQC
ncbi:hypothetical protein SeMB42_g03363 [Synchytrium endobioticum]|nr:hypothetical protein SeMB42_g03363 [Synchytrium endobioticum]